MRELDGSEKTFVALAFERCQRPLAKGAYFFALVCCLNPLPPPPLHHVITSTSYICVYVLTLKHQRSAACKTVPRACERCDRTLVDRAYTIPHHFALNTTDGSYCKGEISSSLFFCAVRLTHSQHRPVLLHNTPQNYAQLLLAFVLSCPVKHIL